MGLWDLYLRPRLPAQAGSHFPFPVCEAGCSLLTRLCLSEPLLGPAGLQRPALALHLAQLRALFLGSRARHNLVSTGALPRSVDMGCQVQTQALRSKLMSAYGCPREQVDLELPKT